MSDYQEVLYKWALTKVPADRNAVRVTDVTFEFNKARYDGCETCGYGADEDTLDAAIAYVEADGTRGWYTHSRDAYDMNSGMAEIIQQLLEIAEKE